MNVTIDTLEIRSVELPAGASAIHAVLMVAMATYIFTSLMSLYQRCHENPLPGQNYQVASFNDETL